MNSLVGRCKLVFNYVVNRGKVKKKKKPSVKSAESTEYVESAKPAD